MIHFDEMTCLLYLEGQLEPPRAREMAAHIGECAACRTLLHALERESHALAAALTEDNEPMPARLLSARSWGVPSWVWTFAFGVFAAGAYWLWTDSIDPWVQQLSNAGFGGTDFVSMLLFSGAFWEGWSDMIDVMQIAALVIVGITAIGLLRRRLRRFAAIAVVMSALALALALPQPTAAAEVRRGRSVFVPASETIHNDLIAAGPSIRIDGTVEGDVIAFTRDLTVTGHVTGDVIAIAGRMRMEGIVDGNVRVISNMVTLEGSVGKNVTSIVNTLDLTSKGQVGGGLITIDGLADLDGRIKRDLLGIIGRTYLDGAIGGEMWLRGGSLAVTSTAEIGGAATFLGREQPVVAAGAKLASPIHTEITQEIRRSRISTARLVIHAIFSYGAALLLGVLLVTVLPGFFRVTLREAGRIGLPIGVGALALITGVFLLVLGILLIFVGVGAGVASVLAYAPILYVAQVFVGAWLGNKILGEASSTTSVVIGRIALGLLILHLAGLLPVLGALMWLVVRLWGTGAVLMGFYRMSRTEAVPLPA
jgi:anti-sigma factor RsiW/cytoskeletal protein CcmA (bactofilin family)